MPPPRLLPVPPVPRAQRGPDWLRRHGRRVGAAYFAVWGVMGLILLSVPLSAVTPPHSAAHSFGAMARQATLAVAALLVAVALLRSWRRASVAAVLLLAVSTVYDGYSFAHGYAHGLSPTLGQIVGGYVAVAAWNAFVAWVILRAEPKQIGAAPSNAA